MGALVTYKCDGEGCESIKREANHWWAVSIDESGLFYACPMVGDTLREGALTMCSESCVSKALSRWMQGNK
jgi:hypothetical protein